MCSWKHGLNLIYFFETANNDLYFVSWMTLYLYVWCGWRLGESVQPLRADRGTMCSALSLPLNLIKLLPRPVESRDIVLVREKEGAAAGFMPLGSQRPSQPGLGRPLCSPLAEAGRVKRSSEATASEASPRYEGTSWAWAAGAEGNVSY